jgi:hypothetical protein
VLHPHLQLCQNPTPTLKLPSNSYPVILCPRIQNVSIDAIDINVKSTEQTWKNNKTDCHIIFSEQEC